MCTHTNILTTKLFPVIGGGCDDNTEPKSFIWQAQIEIGL